MAVEKKILTYAGLRALEDELENLKVVRRKEVAVKIREAREQGDLSENAEYDAAKDEQRDIETRIEEIEKILKHAEVVVEDEYADLYMEAQIMDYQNQIVALNNKITELEKQIAIYETTNQKVVEETIDEQNASKDKYDINELDEIYRNDKVIINSYHLLNNPNERAFEMMTDEYLLNGVQKRMNEIDNAQNVTFEYYDKYQKYAIRGTIKLNGVTYKYQASNRHDLPIIYGCFDMDEIRQAKEMIETSVPSFTFFELADEELEQDKVIYDFENKIVVWINRKDNSFKGYTENYAFVWDGQSEYPTGVQHKYNKFDTDQYSKMGEWTVQTGKNKGQKAQRGAKEAALILSTCKALITNNEEPEQANEEMEFIYTAGQGQFYCRIEERIAEEKRLASIAENKKRREEEIAKQKEKNAAAVAACIEELKDLDL